jgi:hypothetical protein
MKSLDFTFNGLNPLLIIYLAHGSAKREEFVKNNSANNLIKKL